MAKPRYARYTRCKSLPKNISMKGPRNRRSLRSGRDDKGESWVFQWGLVADIPGLKSETWGTFRLFRYR
jgi:hypothetical protein